MTPSQPPAAFINMPYSPEYERLYLAYISGLSAFGFAPTAALADPSNKFQLAGSGSSICLHLPNTRSMNCRTWD